MGNHSNNPPGIKALTICGWAGLALTVFSLGFYPLRTSTDEWWHLKSGKWIVEHNWQPPARDVFTYTAADYDWENHEWLSQALMYSLWDWGDARDIGGWRGIILAKALLLVLTYLLLGLLLKQIIGPGTRGHLLAVFLTLVAAAAGRRMFWPRPPIISNLLFVLFIYLLWAHRTGRLRTRYLLILPALMPLWANLHGGFVLGGLAVAAWFGGDVIDWAFGKWIAKRPDADLRPIARRIGVYLILGILCGLGSLLNPWGYKLYLLSGRVMKCKELIERLGELQPPLLRYTWAYVFLFVLMFATILMALVATVRFLRNKQTIATGTKIPGPPLPETLIALFFFWQSIHHMRHMVLFGLAAAPLVAWGFSRFITHPKVIRLFWPVSLVLATWLIFFPGEAIHTIPAAIQQTTGTMKENVAFGPSQFDRNRQLLNGAAYTERDYPVRAVSFILTAKLPPRMYNQNNCAGYLVWALSPEHYKVFTDSRFDIFGQDFFGDEMSVAHAIRDEKDVEYYKENFKRFDGEEVSSPIPGMRPWREVVKKWGINWIFMERSNKMINGELAMEDSGWKLVYQDIDWLIWLEDKPENKAWIDKYNADALTQAFRNYVKQASSEMKESKE